MNSLFSSQLMPFWRDEATFLHVYAISASLAKWGIMVVLVGAFCGRETTKCNNAFTHRKGLFWWRLSRTFAEIKFFVFSMLFLIVTSRQD
jgi:hypothetical protein